jgi:hypothetical protein
MTDERELNTSSPQYMGKLFVLYLKLFLSNYCQLIVKVKLSIKKVSLNPAPMDKKLNFILILIGLFLSLSLIFLGINVSNPEEVIQGEWEEIDWAYEKIENNSVLDLGLDEIKKHEAENWKFRPGNNLEFYKEGQLIAQAGWRIKGRGHILQILHEDGSQELFDIKELNNDEMVLHFDIGMETRGIAKLIFQR